MHIKCMHRQKRRTRQDPNAIAQQAERCKQQDESVQSVSVIAVIVDGFPLDSGVMYPHGYEISGGERYH